MDDEECGNGFENHRGGDGLLERGVVHESLVAALVEFFAGEVEPDGAAVVDERDVDVLRRNVLFGFRGVRGGTLRRGGRRPFGRLRDLVAETDDGSEGGAPPFNYFVQTFGDGVAVVQSRMLAGNMDMNMPFVFRLGW